MARCGPESSGQAAMMIASLVAATNSHNVQILEHDVRWDKKAVSNAELWNMSTIGDRICQYTVTQIVRR